MVTHLRETQSLLIVKKFKSIVCFKSRVSESFGKIKKLFHEEDEEKFDKLKNYTKEGNTNCF